MAKPDRRNLKVPPSLSGLIAQALLDLGRYLQKKDLDEVIISLHSKSDLEDTLSLIEEKLCIAENTASTEFLELAAWRQLQSLFVKNKDAPGSSVQGRYEAAICKFISSEKKCKRTNKRLQYYSKRMGRLSSDIQLTFSRARDIISDIMGPLGHSQLYKIADGAGFGPGFTFSSSKSDHRNLYYKVAGPHSVTREALPYAKVFLNQYPHWKMSLIDEGGTYDVVKGNRVTSVPKNAVTDRTIAIEPSLNVFMQKGVDSYLKERLRPYGVTLDNQERNHVPAREGSSKLLHAATLDLSSASDNVSIEVVRLLFPREWFVLLDDLRSKNYTMDQGKGWHCYEKFSSMGNAFTFPIETILFYALAKSCTIEAGGNLDVLRVYGDDIIVDPRAYALLVELLGFLGFDVNSSKSFVFGNFRETCGSDFLSGVDLRPVYVKNLPRNDQEVYNLFNRFIWNRVGFRLHNLCKYLYACVAKPLIGPAHLPPGKKYWRWMEGKSVRFDHYFHSSSEPAERFKRYDPDLQCFSWRIQLLRFIPGRADTNNWNMQFRYLAFLLGMPGSKVDSTRFFRRVVQYENITYWPAPPWDPDLYGS
jgi:hypothetical protein